MLVLSILLAIAGLAIWDATRVLKEVLIERLAR